MSSEGKRNNSINCLYLHSPRRRLTGFDLDRALCSWWWIHRWSRGWGKEKNCITSRSSRCSRVYVCTGENNVNVLKVSFMEELKERQWARHRKDFMYSINSECPVTSVCVHVQLLPPVSVPVIHLHFDCPVEHIKRQEEVFACVL